ncbi:MAG: hypothetical protein DRP30_01145 [Thermotoga sp.]|nr:MAG: hypothetical protein DRP30_01145 [Thermotoga sp.]
MKDGIIEKKFEQIDHQADLAFIVYGKNVEELLKNFLELLRQLLSVKKTGRIVKTVDFHYNCLEDLIFDLGNEIIFEFETNHLFPSNLTSHGSKITLIFSTVDESGESVGIKALTYHGLKVEKENGILRTIVVFDV